MNETVSPAQIIEELRRLPENARKIFGMAWLDEAAFYQLMTRLRHAAMPAYEAVRKMPKSSPERIRATEVLRLSDNFEQFVEDAKQHLFDQVAANENEILQRVQNLETALRAQFGAFSAAAKTRDDASPFSRKSPFESR